MFSLKTFRGLLRAKIVLHFGQKFHVLDTAWYLGLTLDEQQK
jgi:hypothetical protein